MFHFEPPAGKPISGARENLVVNRGNTLGEAVSICFAATLGHAIRYRHSQPGDKMAESLKLFLRETALAESAAIPTFLLVLTAIFAWQATRVHMA